MSFAPTLAVDPRGISPFLEVLRVTTFSEHASRTFEASVACEASDAFRTSRGFEASTESEAGGIVLNLYSISFTTNG